jgi:hypothetical protein
MECTSHSKMGCPQPFCKELAQVGQVGLGLLEPLFMVLLKPHKRMESGGNVARSAKW